MSRLNLLPQLLDGLKGIMHSETSLSEPRIFPWSSLGSTSFHFLGEVGQSHSEIY